VRRLTEHLPIALLAVIAACGSFTHIADLARRSGQTGWQAYATAVCVDLLAVVAAGEIRRDQRLGKRSTVPVLVLAGAIVLSLAANLAEAQPTVWGRICAGIPAAAFLLATALLERRSSGAETPQEAEPVIEMPQAVEIVEAPQEPVQQRADDLIERARQADSEHRAATGRPISRDSLRGVLGCSTGKATEVLRTLRTA
jgi:hypothetical protein